MPAVTAAFLRHVRLPFSSTHKLQLRTYLVEAAVELHNNLAGAVVVDNLKLLNVA
jgi:hypothetical protein